MKVPPRIFLDASVLIAAAGSRTGASTLVLALCRHGHARAVSSRLVLLEAERNIRDKLGEEALLRFYAEIAALDIELREAPSQDDISRQAPIIGPKDAHVLAAALQTRVEVLLTLDRKHFFSASVRQAVLPFRILTPGDFLREQVR